MQDLITIETAATTAPKATLPTAPRRLDARYFADFIAWIDRKEKTAQTYINNLRTFAAWMKSQQIEAPQRQDIINYRQWLQTEHFSIALDPESLQGWKVRKDGAGQPIKLICKPTTAAAYLRSVCQFFRWTAVNGLYPNIAENIHAPRLRKFPRKEALQPEDVSTIERSIASRSEERHAAALTAEKDKAGKAHRSTEQGARLYAMYLLAVTAGLRCVEISRARIKDFQQTGNKAFLMIWGKGHEEADFRKAIAPEVANAIQAYLKTRSDRFNGNSPLFVSTGNRSGGKAIATTTISTMLKRAMRDAGYDSERLTAHSLRHTACNAALEITGDNIFITQRYMRHTSPETTEIYIHKNTEKQEAAIAQRILDYYRGQPSNEPSFSFNGVKEA